MPDNKVKSYFTPPPEPQKPAAAPRTFMDRVADTAAVIPRVAGMGIRLGSGALASEGGPMGAAIAGGGEAVAEGIEGLSDYMQGKGLPDWKTAGARIGVEAGLGAIPLGSIVSKGRVAASAAKGALMGGVGLEGRKWAQGEGITNPAKDWDMGDYANVALGAGLGAFGGRLGKTNEAPLSINPRNVPDAIPTNPVAPPPAPRPNITKPAGLRVFTGFEKDPTTGQSVYTGKKLDPTPEEHVTLSKKLTKVGPQDPLYKELGTPAEDINPNHAQVEKRYRESQELQNKEAAGDIQTQMSAEADKMQNATQAARNLNAGDKFVKNEQVQESRNLNARDKFIGKEQGQEAKNLNARDKFTAKEEKAAEKLASDIEAKAKIDAAKEGLVPSEPSVSERTSVRDGNTTESVSRRFTKPPEPEGEDLGDPTITTAPPPVIPAGAKTIYGTKKQAIFEAKSLGAVDVVKNPSGPGWVHVYPQNSPSIVPSSSAKVIETNASDNAIQVYDELEQNQGLDPDRFKGYVPQNTGEPLPTPKSAPPLGSGGEAPKNLKLGGKLAKPMEDVKLSQGVTKTTKEGKIEQAYKPGATATPAGVVLENTQGKWNRKEFPAEPIPPEPTAPPSGKVGKKGMRVGPKNEAPVPAVAEPAQPTATPTKPGRGKAVVAPLSEEQLAQMSEGDRRAYFKKTAPAEDANFALKQGVPLSPALAAKWQQLQAEAPKLPRGEAMRRLHSLQDEWRAGRVTSERAAGEPQVGTKEWQDAEGIKSSAQDLPPLPEDPQIPPGMPGLAQRLKSETGSLDPEFAQALLMHGGGALVGAAIGGNADDDHPVRGALLGGALGAAAPLAAKGLMNGRVDTEELGDKLKNLGRALPNAMRFNLLMDPPSLGINVLAAPWGSGVLGSAEQGLTGLLSRDKDMVQSAGRSLKAFGNVAQWPKRVWDATDEAAESIGRNERGELMTGEAESPTQRAMALPGTAMTAGDIASRNILENEGDLSNEVARRITNTGEPRTPTGRKIANMGRSTPDDEGKKAILAKLMLPFSRTAVNVVESGLERAPVIGMFLNFSPESEHHLAEILARQGVSAGVGFAAYHLGANIDQDTVRTYRINKLVSNMAGQYGLIASAAFAAGMASQQGKDQVGAGMTAAWRELPLPTTQTPQDILRSATNIAQGQPAHPNAKYFPQRWLPNAAVPGLIRDQFLSDVEEHVLDPAKAAGRSYFRPPVE